MTANASREPSIAVLSDIAPDSGRKLTSTEKWRFGVGFVLFSPIWMVAALPDRPCCCRNDSPN